MDDEMNTKALIYCGCSRHLSRWCFRNPNETVGQVSPIHLGSQRLTSNFATGLAVNANRDGLVKLLADRDCLAQITYGGTAPEGKADLIRSRKPVQIGEKVFHKAVAYQIVSVNTKKNVPLGILPIGICPLTIVAP
jgi:hypothetical protein